MENIWSGPFIYQFSQIHDGRGRFVDVPHLLPGEAEHLERLVGELQVLVVVDGLDLGLALGQSEDSVSCRIDQSEGSIHLRHVVVVVDVVREQTFLLQLRDGGLHQLVEDVVGSLHLLLEGDPGLLQEVGLDVAPGQLPLDVEVDPDELALHSREDISNFPSSRKLTNLDELSFLAVLALPKASRTGLVWTI